MTPARFCGLLGAMSTRGVFGTLDPFLENGPVLGRRVANAGFLKHLLQADPFDAYHFFLADQGARTGLELALDVLAPDIRKAGRILALDRRELPARLAGTDYACFHQSDCILHQAHVSRLRNAHARTLFPVTGPIHSLSYPDYPAAFLHHLWAGATPRDCVIATSRAGKAAVEEFFAHLRRGLALRKARGPSVRILPLGVDPDLAATPLPASLQNDGERAALKASLGLPADRVLILVLGRISHSSKMDVLPLLRSLSHLAGGYEGAPRVDPASLALVLAGWTDDEDAFPDTLVELGARLGVRVVIDRRPGERRKAGLLSACDLFVSIADNPQETFGITLLEAQAAGLPVVASDYSGYRDLVEEGVTGLLIPTTGPQAGPVKGGDPNRLDHLDQTGQDGPRFFPDDGLADRLAPVLFDNQYHLLQAQRVAVDTGALALALGALLSDPQRRREMGRAGRERVRAQFLWPHIVGRHVELWRELAALHAPDIETLRAVPHPLHLPYARIFAGYPSRPLTPELRLGPGRAGQALLAGQEHPMLYAGLSGVIRPNTLRSLVFLARKGVRAGDLAGRWLESNAAPYAGGGSGDGEGVGLDMEAAASHILWALKHDLLRLEPPQPAGGGADREEEGVS